MQQLYLRSARNIFVDYLMIYHFSPKGSEPTLKSYRLREVPGDKSWEASPAGIQGAFLPAPSEALLLRNFILTPWLALRLDLYDDTITLCRSTDSQSFPCTFSWDPEGNVVVPLHINAAWNPIIQAEENFDVAVEEI